MKGTENYDLTQVQKILPLTFCFPYIFQVIEIHLLADNFVKKIGKEPYRFLVGTHVHFRKGYFIKNDMAAMQSSRCCFENLT